MDNSKILKEQIIDKVKNPLQKEYGDKNDCTLVSITNFIDYYLLDYYDFSFGSIYDLVAYQAKRQFIYHPKLGSNPLAISCLVQYMLKIKFKINKYKMKTKLFKTKNFFNIIEKSIMNNKPVILSILNTKDKKYTWHTIVIKGIRVIEKDGEITKSFIISDNWSPSKNKILDLDNLGFICSINYLRN